MRIPGRYGLLGVPLGALLSLLPSLAAAAEPPQPPDALHRAEVAFREERWADAVPAAREALETAAADPDMAGKARIILCQARSHLSKEFEKPEEIHRTGGATSPPTKIAAPSPVLSDVRLARLKGTVIVESTIDREGCVRDATAPKGLPQGLSDAALKAVRLWVFSPATVEGKPVAVSFKTTITFSGEGETSKAAGLQPDLQRAQKLLAEERWAAATDFARQLLRETKPDDAKGKQARIVLCQARSHLPEEAVPNPREIGSGVSRPVKIAGAPPRYPEKERKDRRPARIVLDAVIDQEGCVGHVDVAKGGTPDITAAAVQTLRSSWVFLPSLAEGQPVAVKYQLTVTFQPW